MKIQKNNKPKRGLKVGTGNKELKKELKTQNFVLTDVFQNIKLGWKPVDISFLLGISQQGLQYYLDLLKNNGFIKKIGYATWEVKKELKNFSLGTRPTTNLHALQINFPILEGKINDKDWQLKEKLNNWIPKYKENIPILGGLTFKNNNNKSLTVFASTRNIKDIEEVDNLSFKIRAYIFDYFKKAGVILDVMNCKTTNLNLATEDKDAQSMIRKGERFELGLNKKAEKIFKNDNIDGKAWIDSSPFKFSAETNDKEWKREYLKMPFRIKDMFSLINAQLQLLDIQTKSTYALSQNIMSHIPSWMSNIKVEQELKKLRRQISERQKRLGDWL